MGGFFGAVSANDCVLDVFYGTDYHSHLGTRRGGMTSYSAELGFQRNIHSIENSPFRTKFEKDVEKMRGNICIGCISDTDPQPIMVRSKLGLYAVCSIGIIQNAKALSEELLEEGFVREIISKVQTMRKEAGFEVMDKIVVYAHGNDKIQDVMKAHEDEIKSEVLADEMVLGETDGYVKEWNINKEAVTMGVKKL